MDKEQIVEGFNKWLDEYIKDPKAFLETQQSINKHLHERLDGEEPTYGQRCEAALVRYAIS